MYPIALLGVPFAVYLLARVIFLAYFHAKRDHLKGVLRGIDQKTGSGPDA